MISTIFHLFCAAIGTESFFKRPITSEEWGVLYRIDVLQGVIAVMFDFVNTLSKSEDPDKALLME